MTGPYLSRASRPIADARLQAVVVVFGGLLVLQASQELDGTKLAYLVLAGLSAVAASIGAARWFGRGGVSLGRWWLGVAVAMLVLITCSALASRQNGTSISAWFRDVMPYALFGFAPILALGLARRASARWLVGFWLISGALAALSFSITWLDRRDIASLPIDRLVLPSATLAASAIGLATALAITRPLHWRWAVLGGLVLGLFLVTGTRSALLLLIVPVGLAIGCGRGAWRVSAAAITAEVVVAFSMLVIVNTAIAAATGGPWISEIGARSTPSPLASTMGPSPTPAPSGTGSAGSMTPGPSASATGTQPAPSPTATETPHNRLAERIGGAGQVLMDPGSDQSFQERLAQSKVAWDAFLSAPLLGKGPGYLYTWTDSSHHVRQAPWLDSPLVVLAKFGLLGLFWVIFFAAAYLLLLARLIRKSTAGARFAVAALVSYALVIAVISLQGSPIEDKGASFALIPVLAIAMRELESGIGHAHEQPSEAR